MGTALVYIRGVIALSKFALWNFLVMKLAIKTRSRYMLACFITLLSPVLRENEIFKTVFQKQEVKGQATEHSVLPCFGFCSSFCTRKQTKTSLDKLQTT
jgi:hypothetical protein